MVALDAVLRDTLGENTMKPPRDDPMEVEDSIEEGRTPSPPAAAPAAARLSKSWSIQAAHVPTFTGGKVTSSLSYHSREFLLLPVGGDLALVDARRGVKVKTLRGEEDGIMIDDDDDEEEGGLDADAITCYAQSPNQELLLTASRNQLLRQYSCTDWIQSSAANDTSTTSKPPITPTKVWGKSGHTLPVTHMEFHPSSVFLCTGSVDGTVRIWDVRGGYVTHVFRPIGSRSSTGGMHAVTCLEWQKDATQLVLAIGRDDGSIVIHDLKQSTEDKQQMVTVLRDHVSAVTCLAWDASAALFVSAGRDCVLNTWQIIKETKTTKKKKKGSSSATPPTVTYQRIHTLPIYEQVEGMVLLPPSSQESSELRLATAGSKGVVRLWKAQKASGDSTPVVSGFRCCSEQPAAQAFGTERGGYMTLLYHRHHQQPPEAQADPATSSTSDAVDQLIVADAEHNLSFLSLSTLAVDRTIVGHNDEILDLKVIPGTDRIVVATNSSQVRLFDLASFSCDVMDGHTATVLCVNVSPCGRYLATCGKDKTMRVWHVGSQRCVAVATGHMEAIGATALSCKTGKYEVRGKAANSGGGAFCVTASKDRTLKRWNLPGATDLDEAAQDGNEITLKAFASARAHEKDINIVSVAPNDSLVATGSQDKTVKLWRSTDLTLQATLKGHRRGVWDCQFSPFDRVVATASGDRTVKLWSLGDYSCVRTFQGHVASALRVRFLSSGLQLVSSGADGLVKLWTIRTNECEATMDGHANKVWALDTSPNGKTLVSGGADSQIVVWNDTTQEEEQAKRATEEENILMEQKLANHLRYKEFEQALEVALELDKPRQALKVLTCIVENDIKTKNQNGLATLQRHVKGWSMERTLQILQYCRDWNTRARNSHLSMLVVQAIVTSIPAQTLAATPGIPAILAGITPYAERHFDRLDRLQASTYLLDFVLYSMGSLQDESEEAFKAWETSSRLVLPPKRVDARYQVGGSAVVGTHNVEDDDQDEVVSIGESEDSSDEEEDGLTRPPSKKQVNEDSSSSDSDS